MNEPDPPMPTDGFDENTQSTWSISQLSEAISKSFGVGISDEQVATRFGELAAAAASATARENSSCITSKSARRIVGLLMESGLLQVADPAAVDSTPANSAPVESYMFHPILDLNGTPCLTTFTPEILAIRPQLETDAIYRQAFMDGALSEQACLLGRRTPAAQASVSSPDQSPL